VGYELKSLQILGGSYNALTPVDKTPITDYLLAQNWRSDALGRLISRAGYVGKFSLAGAGIAHSAASTGGVSSPYYVGCNSGVSNPTSAVYYLGGAAPATPIQTGFDGNRIAFASQNSFMWIMNRAVQGRHSPSTGWQTWNLTPPPASVTAVAAAGGSTVTSVTFTYTWQGTTVAASIASGAQTVTPASMTGITVGMNLGISNSDYSHYEIVTVTAVTGTTFTANFSTTKTGAGILVAFSDYVHFLAIAGNNYSFVQNGYSAAQVPLVMAGISSGDANCSVTYPGTGNTMVITPIVPFTLFVVTGSDGNGSANLASGTVASLPNGTYQYYATFQSADLSLESNPSPVSLAVPSVANDAITVTIPAADAPTDARVGFINLYRTGGTLGQAYRVAQIASTVASPATTFSDSMGDLTATQNGLVLPTQNDPAPAASGMIGPQWSRLYAWNTVAHPNRLYYTPANQPQYWPGSNDEQVGNWVDVGLDGEGIIWCTIHTNLLVIYKERSIWMLVGDPSTGTLQPVYDGIGLAGQWAVTPAGLIDYFVGPNGLYLFDLNEVHELAGNILPIFNQSVTNAGPLTAPGSILPGSAFNSTSLFSYSVALGHALGKLYITYAEKGTGNFNLLIFDEGAEPERNAYLQARAGRWFYQRNAIAGTIGGFFGFFFDGVAMVGLTGAVAGAAQGFNLDDFRAFLTADPGAVPIECVYQSHYDDVGHPDNDKMWLEVRVDYEFAAGANATVYAGFNNGAVAPVQIGILGPGVRQTAAFGFPGSIDGGILARNISIVVDVLATGLAVIHNVYLYFYVEARLAIVASTIPTDLGVGKIKECKELALDINAGGNVAAAIQSDFPGNVLATRVSPAVAASAGRGIRKFPFATQRGLLWQVTLVGGPFRLYSARLLMRVVGTFIEGYEAGAGFVWDSQESTLGTDMIKRGREISLEIDTFGGPVTVALLTDLPGNAQVVRFTQAVSNAGGRSFIRIPLPQGLATAIEGRYFRLQISGAVNWALYGASIEFLAIGVYIEAYEAAGGAVYDSRHLDFGTPKVKEAREIELDIHTSGALTASLYGDLPPVPGTGVATGTPTASALVATGTANTSGRQTVRIPVTVNAALEQFAAARQFRLLLSSSFAYRLYGARLLQREYGQFLTQDEISGGALWDSTERDMGTQKTKVFKRIEVDLRTFSNAVTVTVLTSQAGETMSLRYTWQLATNGARRPLTFSLPPGIQGRLLQVLINGTACALYAVRVWWRALNDAKAEWGWADLPCEPTQPAWTWSPFPVVPTDAQWTFAPVASVEATDDIWKWVDIDLAVTDGG